MTSHVAFLNGTLDVKLADGQLLDGALFGERGSTQTVSVLQTTGAIQGKFDSVSNRHLGNGVFFDLSYDARNVNLDVLTALPGDANGDGSVDATDLGIWQSNRFKLGSWTDGDFSGDGLVDGSDFNLWRANSFEGELNLPDRGRAPRAALAARAVTVPDSAATLEVSDHREVDVATIDRSVGLVAAADNVNQLGRRRTVDRDARRVRGQGSQNTELQNTRLQNADSQNLESQPAWTNLVDNLFAGLGDVS